MGGQVLFRNLMFAFPGRATHHGEVTLLRAGVQPPAEPTRHAFQMGVVQMVFRAKRSTPPNSEASGIVTGGKVGIHVRLREEASPPRGALRARGTQT